MCHFLPLCWVCYLTCLFRIVKGRLENITGKHSPIPWYIYRYIGGTHERNGGTFFYHCGSLEKTVSSLLCGNTKNKTKEWKRFSSLWPCWVVNCRDSFACDVHLLKPKSLMMTVQHKSLPHTQKVKEWMMEVQHKSLQQLKWKSWWWSTLIEISWATKSERVDDGLTLLTTQSSKKCHCKVIHHFVCNNFCVCERERERERCSSQ